MDVKNLVEVDWVAEMLSSYVPLSPELSFNIRSSLDESLIQLPLLVVTASVQPLIATNYTFEVLVKLSLHTQSDDMLPADAVSISESIINFIDEAFYENLEMRALCWSPVHLEFSTTDSSTVDDRRFIQVTDFRLIVQA